MTRKETQKLLKSTCRNSPASTAWLPSPVFCFSVYLSGCHLIKYLLGGCRAIPARRSLTWYIFSRISSDPVSGIVPWASFETISPPPAPSHSIFFWVHFETPLTEFKNLESWDGPFFLYLHILLRTTLRGKKKILPYIEPDLSWDTIWQQAPTFCNMSMETPGLSCWGRTAQLILHHSDHSSLVGLRCSPTQKPPHRWKMPSFLKITDCPASLSTSCFQALTPLEEPVRALVTHHALLGV